MRKLTLFIILIFCQVCLEAQQGQIEGTVFENENTPLEFANILLKNSMDSSFVKGVVSETDGSFSFDKINHGDYFVQVSMIGFEDVSSSSFTLENEDLKLDPITMNAGIALDEVTVVTQKPFIEMQADKIVVNIENSSVNAGNNALEVLQKSPGVDVDQDNNISLRGKQGVLVTINGKNQYMRGEEISQLLETMPAESIEKIELIMNPSSRYDAEGNAGIINIVLKKNENLGMNGSVNTTVRVGNTFSNNQGINLNYRSEKLNVYGSLNRYDWESLNNLELLRRIPTESGGLTVFDQDAIFNHGGVGYDSKIGIDYQLGKNTSVGVLVKYNDNVRDGLLSNMTRITGDDTPPFGFLQVITNEDGDRNQWSYNLNFNQKLDDKGSTLSADFDLSNYQNKTVNHYDNSYQDANGNEVLDPEALRNYQNTNIDIKAAKVDYNTKLDDINFELGAKISMVETDNATLFEINEGGEWIDQVNRSNNFVYKEDVMAAYVNASKAFGGVMVQAGLRMEHTSSVGNSITLDQKVERDYTNFFPSLSISHTINEKHSLSYSYSRRINRPNYKSLNPFINYLDDYTFEKGNPFLNPQYSDAFSVNYGLGRSLFVSADYSYTKDAITEVIEQVSDSKLTFKTEANLENFHNASLTFSMPKVWTEWWTSRVSWTTFYNAFESDIPSGRLNNASVATNLYVQNNIQLGKNLNGEVTGNYRSPLTYGLFQVKSQYGIDLGLSANILQGKGSLKIGLDDVFKTRINRVNVIQDDINFEIKSTRDTRRAKLSFNYRFGNAKVKAAKRRKTATEEENSRISN